jgi:hypothetical protein
MKGSKVRTAGKVTQPAYVAEWEYYDFQEHRKVVERNWPKSGEEVRQFREQLVAASFDELIKAVPGSRVLTGIRIYKGDEIIYDCYCQFAELSMLNAISEKMSALYKQA